MDPTYPLAPILNLLAAFLVLIPLPYHTKFLNTGVCMFALWTCAGCLITFVNTIAWHGSLRDGPGWCDIAGRFAVALPVAIPSCSLATNIRLYRITKNVRPPTGRLRKAELALDLTLCLGIPFLIMVLYYVVQMQRYAITEDIGCGASYFTSIPSIFIIDFPSLFLSAISTLFTPFILYEFIKRRKSAEEFRQASSGGKHFQDTRYLRFMILSCFDLFVSLPVSIIGFFLDVVPLSNVSPWPGWHAVHSNISQVAYTTAQDFQTFPYSGLLYFWIVWIYVIWAFGFFALFGLTRDMRRRYVSAFKMIVCREKKTPSKRSNSRLWNVVDIEGGRGVSPMPQRINIELEVTQTRECFVEGKTIDTETSSNQESVV